MKEHSNYFIRFKKPVVVLSVILFLTAGLLSTYISSRVSCYRNNSIIRIDNQSKHLLSQVFKTPLPTKCTRGFVITGTNVAVHILTGNMFKYPDMIPYVEKPIYGKCIPVIARYEIDPTLEKLAYSALMEAIELNTPISPYLLYTFVSPSVINSGTLNEVFGYIDDPYILDPFLLTYYVWFPVTRGESDWLNGRVYLFPNSKTLNIVKAFYKNEFVKSEDIYKFAILGFKFPTVKVKINLNNIELPSLDIKRNISRKEYMNIAKGAYKSGLINILNELKQSNGIAKTILLPALNTPAFPYFDSGEAQALSIREIAAKQSLKINTVKHYDPLDNSPQYYHIIFVAFNEDSPANQSAYIAGIKKGFTEDIFTPQATKFILVSLLSYLIFFFIIALLLIMLLFVYIKRNSDTTENVNKTGNALAIFAALISIIFGVIGGSLRSPIQTGMLIGGIFAIAFASFLFFNTSGQFREDKK